AVPVATDTVSDGSLTDTATLTLGPVTPVNDAPVASDDIAVTTEGRPVVIDVLANDSDGNGDPLTIITASSPNGPVTVRPDGTLRFTPAAGFTGIATISYTVSDGRGGMDTALVAVTVRPAPVEPPVAPPVGPDFVPLDDERAPPEVVATETPRTSLAVDGMVLDAVRGVDPQRAVANQLSERGMVLTAVNDVETLRGIAGADMVGRNEIAIPLEAWRMWELERLIERYDGSHAGAWSDAHGLTGYSLRLGLAGAPDGSEDGSRIVLESLVRDRVLIVEISSSLADHERQVVEYRILQANGEPLPAWLERVGASVLIGQRPADLNALALRITVLYSDGSFETKEVEVDAISGEIEALAAKRGASLPVPFTEQFAVQVPLNDDDVAELARALAG
ncbi:MAG: Ig-like domain-containing protein, partial [Pseudomonadota bacterium]